MIHSVSRLRRSGAALLVLLLLPLQLLAPLLHAHAVDDPLRAVSTGVHVPGLERLERDQGAQLVFTERSFSLVEEADLARRDTGDDALPSRPPRALVRGSPSSRGCFASGQPVFPGNVGCHPPPSRAPPSASSQS